MCKRKVLYLISTLKASGPVNVLFNLIKYLNRERFEPIILTLSPEPQDSALYRFHELGIPIHSLEMSRLLGFVRGKSVLKSFVAQCCPDVIHSHGIRADLLSAQCLPTYKRVSTIHNYPYDDYIMKYGKLFGWYMAWQQIRALQQIDFPVAISKSLAKNVQAHRLKPYTILNGVDLSLYSAVTKEERIALRHKLNLPQNQTIFVSVGQLIRRKDPETIIRGFLESKAKNNSILLLIGDGNLRKYCEIISRGEDCVRLTGQVSNVADYLKAADYLISASLSEGLGYAVLEALACGIPVCISDIEPYREILSLNHRAGLLFTVGKAQALTARINELLKAEIEVMSEAALQIIIEHLSAKQMAINYQTIYESN